MEKRELGKSGIFVPPLMLGGNVFGWTIDEKQSFKILDAFMEAGLNFIDTADTYSWWADGNVGGESEAIIGKWMASRGNRDKIILATKVGSQNRAHKENVSKAYILKTVEESLKRLQTDYIDLYQTHFDNEATPVEETLSAYDKLIKEGKVRIIGASNLSPERLNESLKAAEGGLPRYQTLQPHYNLYERENYEVKYEKIATDNSLSVLTYWSLASGFLTGKYRSEADLNKSVRGGAVKKYLDERGMKILNALDEVAEKCNTSVAAVALAWLIFRPSVTAPISSATTLPQLETLVNAVQLKLTPEDIELLTSASEWK